MKSGIIVGDINSHFSNVFGINKLTIITIAKKVIINGIPENLRLPIQSTKFAHIISNISPFQNRYHLTVKEH